jgi:hypothetical protein
MGNVEPLATPMPYAVNLNVREAGQAKLAAVITPREDSPTMA